MGRSATLASLALWVSMIGTTPATGLDRRMAGLLVAFSDKSRLVESSLTLRVSMAREPREREALRV